MNRSGRLFLASAFAVIGLVAAWTGETTDAALWWIVAAIYHHE